MEIYLHFIILLLFLYSSTQKTLEEKMNNCILYLSNETSTYKEIFKELKHLDTTYKNNEITHI